MYLFENYDEIVWVNILYLDCEDYLVVYEKYYMVCKCVVFGYCIYLLDSEWQCMGVQGVIVVFCLILNLFLGSGLFDMVKVNQFNVLVILVIDVGGGISFSMFKIFGEVYKICQLKQYKLLVLEGFYKFIQGVVVSLGLSDKIGNFNIGSDVDFVVLNLCFDMFILL